MSRSILLYSVVVGFGAGLLIGLMLWGAREAPPPAPPPVADSPDTSLPQPPERKSAQDAAPAEAVNTEPATLFERAMREAQAAPLLPRGDGVITGRVVLAGGAPLPGIRVRAAPDLPVGYASWAAAEEYARRQLTRIRRIEAAQVFAATDDKGEFRLTGLADIAYLVRPLSDRYHFTNDLSRAVIDGDHITFTAVEACRVTVNVLEPDGTQAGAALITGWGPGDSRDNEWTPQNNELWLIPGEWNLTAWRKKNDPVRSEPIVVVVTHDLTPIEVEFRLVARNGIEGKFLIPRALLEGRFELRHAPEDQAELLLPDEHGNMPEGRDVRADGRFELIGLAPGQWVVALYLGHEIARAIVTVGEGVTEVEIPVPEPEIADYIPVRVLDPNGAILHDATVSCRAVSTTGSERSWGISRPNGSLWMFKGRIARGGQMLRWEIEATHDKFGVRKAVYGLNDTHELEIHFEAAATLIVEITNAATHPRRRQLGIVGTELSQAFVWWSEPAVSYDYESLPDAPLPERKVFGPTQPGPWVIRLYYGRFRALTILLREVDLKPGEQTLRIEAPEVHDLAMTIPDIDGVKHASLYAFGREIQSTEADANRGVTWQGLIAGTYRVTLPHQPGAMLVRVPSPASVAFEAAEPDCWEVGRLDSEGIARRAGLRMTDNVRTINGERATGEAALTEIYERALNAPQVVLEVERAGAVITVTITADEFRRAREKFLVLRPALSGD